MTGFTDPFGGSTLQAAQVAYRAVTLTANIVTQWPAQSLTSDQLARLMDVNPTTAAGFSVTLPDAREVSAGMDVFFANRGAYAFDIEDNAGGAIATLTPGQVRYLYLTDNSTAAGTWSSVLFGAVSASLDAASLAGAGLVTVNNTLNGAAAVNDINSDTTVAAGDRTQLFLWTGGTGTLSLPATATLDDFYIEVRNAGTGALTIDPNSSETIDGSATITLNVNESCFVHAGSGAWYTVGRGRNTNFNFTQLVKSVDGGTDTLTLTEAANVVQTYTGTLLAAQTVVVPAVVQVYYISNQTSGAYSFTIQSPTPGTTVSIPTGQNAVLFCDGTNVINASTTVAGLSTLVLAAGSAATPSLALSTTDTGLYSSGSGEVSVSSTGVRVFRFSSAGGVVLMSGAALGGVVSTTSTASLVADRVAGQVGEVILRTNGVNRWGWRATSVAEGGSNAGTNLELKAYDDAGAVLSTPISVVRSTGVVTISSLAATLTGNVTGNLTGNVTGNVTGDLTGNVTGNVSGTALNVTGTVAVATGGTGGTTQAAGRLGLGFTLTGFSVATSASRTTTGTFDTYSTEHFDLGGDFNTSTGVFTAPVAGVYQFNAIIQGTNTATSNFTAGFSTNGYGSPTPSVTVGSAASGSPSAVVSAAVRMAAGNTCKVQLYGITNVGWAPVVSHFSGFLAIPE